MESRPDPPLYLKESEYLENLRKIYGYDGVINLGNGHFQIKKTNKK